MIGTMIWVVGYDEARSLIGKVLRQVYIKILGSIYYSIYIIIARSDWNLNILQED